jgi:molybdenum cofactor synthesis domain-containing protein
MIKTAILTVSDTRNKLNDESGKAIMELLRGFPPPCGEGKGGGNSHPFSLLAYDIVKDDNQAIKDILIHYADSLCVDVILTTGGTGLGPRDVTPEATAEVIDRQVPGISEFIRIEGLKYTEKSMLSRGISGIRKNSLIINLPGSPKGARESLNTVLKILPHAVNMLKGEGHNK